MSDQESFKVQITVRGYEIDANGHVASSVILQYAQHARWECLRAAGVKQEGLLQHRLGPISLEENIRFHAEFNAGDVVDITCKFQWGAGKTFEIIQELCRDGLLLATVTNKGGLMDLDQRRLVTNPAERWRMAAGNPQLLGL